MPAVPSGRVFGCNYKDKDEVIALAKLLGKGQTVTKHQDRPNYNICHTENRHLWDIPGVEVIYQT